MTAERKCHLCQDTHPTFYCRKDDIDVYQCAKCGLIYAGETRNDTELRQHYSKEYFDSYFKNEAIHLAKRFKKRLPDLRRHAPAGNILDVGCGAGFFLHLASQNGYQAKGVELSEFAAEYARTHFSLDVFHGYLSDADLAPESFDIITLWHVLEHVTDPRDFLAQVHALLKKNGLLALEVPNIGSFPAQASGLFWELMAPREHFYYFSPETVSRLLKESGFTIIDLTTFYWTTPTMYFRARAAASKGVRKLFMNSIALALYPLSIMRFRMAPKCFPGDVLLIYARKTSKEPRNAALRP